MNDPTPTNAHYARSYYGGRIYMNDYDNAAQETGRAADDIEGIDVVDPDLEARLAAVVDELREIVDELQDRAA